MKRGSMALLRRTLLAAAACLGLIAMNAAAQDEDPPSQAGRLAIVNGTVSIQPAGSQDWGQASLNYPLGPGDRIFTDTDGRAEVQVGRTYVRIGPNSDVTFVDFSSQAITFGAAQGSMHVRSRGLWEGQSLYVQTPSGTSTATGSADFRVDVYPDQQTAIFTTIEGDLYISGANDFGMDAPQGQALELVGTNPVTPQWLQPNAPDDLDNWSERRDAQIARAASYQYVSPDAAGAEDLDQYGQWQPGTEYGDMWFPNVQQDWQPYHNGHWVNREPWGWVWVEDEPWGYTPFHYGRWVNYHNRWGWIPGAREEHPVWSPALVVFAGGGGGGGGLSMWFPLGPGEAYRPWYPCSPRYVDRVNITNIRETRVVHVQKTYVNVVNVTNVTNVTYVNRTAGTSAMRQQDFAAGRPVNQTAVRVDPRQAQQAQVLAKPQVAPTHQAVISRPPAKPVPVAVNRPVLINAKGLAVAAQPKARPEAPPVKTATPQKTAPPPALSNRVAVAPPQNVKMTPAARQALERAPHPGQQPDRPGQPLGQAPAPGRPATPPAQGQQPAPIPGNQPRPAPIPTPGVRPPAQPAQQEPVRPGEKAQPPNQPVQPGREPVPPPRNENRPAPTPQPGQPPRPTYQQPEPPPRNENRPAPTPQPGQPPRPTYQQPEPPPRNENRPAPTPQPGQPPRPTYQQPGPPPQRPNDRPAPYQPPPSAPPRSNERPAPYQQPAAPPQRPVERPAPPPQQTPRNVERPAPYQQPAPPPRPSERPPQAQPRREEPPSRPAPPPPRQNAEPAPRPAPREQPQPQERNTRPEDRDKQKPHQ
jgi:hypothetical protein